MDKRVILATIIVGVAIMMFASAMEPALARAGGEKGPPADKCLELFNLLKDKVGNTKAIEILKKNGCIP